MSVKKRILLICDDPDDRQLAALVLRNALGDVEILEAGDALAFAEHLAGDGVPVAVADDTLSWAQGRSVLTAVKRHDPGTVTVLLGGDRTDDSSVDARVAKGSGGFLELPATIRRVEQARTPERPPPAKDRAYERLTEQLPAGLFCMTSAGEITKANPALFRLLGFVHEADLIGRQLPDLCGDSEARLSLRAQLERGDSVRDFQTRLRRAGGDMMHACLSYWPLESSAAERGRFQGVLWSITALNDTGAAEREAAPSERYEQLAYAVSHDLQDPLQLIQQYARLLLDKYGNALEHDAARLVHRLVDSTDRMQTMMDGILEYSKVGVESRPLQVVELDEVLRDALANLQASVQASGARVEFENLPSIIGDRRLLVQLFQNLIGNGIKFRAQEAPRVTIKVEDREDDWLVSVADNGIGVDGRFAERIFDMFQRLHTTDEYVGTGIGLALCKRIAERHEGRIWVRSEPGRGSTFFVTISKHLSANLAQTGSDKKAG